MFVTKHELQDSLQSKGFGDRISVSTFIISVKDELSKKNFIMVPFHVCCLQESDQAVAVEKIFRAARGALTEKVHLQLKFICQAHCISKKNVCALYSKKAEFFRLSFFCRSKS